MSLTQKLGKRGRFAKVSRSVCANLREAWSKRRYEAHFISKLTDADGENPGGIKAEKRFHWAGSETDTWLDFAKDCGYLSASDYKRLTGECREVGAMQGSMLNNPTPFLIKDS